MVAEAFQHMGASDVPVYVHTESLHALSITSAARMALFTESELLTYS